MLKFKDIESPEWVLKSDWQDWKWQFRNRLSCLKDFEKYFDLSQSERVAIEQSKSLFQIKVTPYYAFLSSRQNTQDPIRKILMPTEQELGFKYQQQLDPLGEKRNNPTPRIIHRYPDRVLFLVTDHCSVYCRYCTRKHFTGQSQSVVSTKDYNLALNYIRKNKGIREVIFSGGDPLTLSDGLLKKILLDVRSIPHVEIIRIGSRIPVVMPMRVTQELVDVLKESSPVFLMTHFNHPSEVTLQAKQAIELFVDNGIPVLNQMVLLNGVNNHGAIVQALSRRLLFVRVKPYYMFQCDPSEGTDHLRTSIEDSLEIQKKLWGRLSGLALPQLSLDIPGGGGKVGLVPNYEVNHDGNKRTYKGWDGVVADYISPQLSDRITPDISEYKKEWEQLNQ